MSTILASLDELHQALRELEYELNVHRGEQGEPYDSLRPFTVALKQIWIGWSKEILARYFAAKKPNLARMIPASKLVQGVPAEAQLQRLKSMFDSVSETLKKITVMPKTEPLKEAFAQVQVSAEAFARYQANPNSFHEALLALAAASESYLLRLSYELEEQTPPKMPIGDAAAS